MDTTEREKPAWDSCAVVERPAAELASTFATTSKIIFKKTGRALFRAQTSAKAAHLQNIEVRIWMQNSYICSYHAVVKISLKNLDLDSHSDRTTSIKMVCCLVRHPISRENFLIYISIINFIIRRQLLRLSVKLVYNCRGPAAVKRKFLVEFPVGYPHRGPGHYQHPIFFC